jgi:acetyl esterase
MSAAPLASFQDAEPDPPDSALREESVRYLSSRGSVSMSLALPALESALAGDLTALRAFRARFAPRPLPGTVASFDALVSGVLARHYHPPGADPGALPLLLFIHGGGWAHQRVGNTDALCADLALQLACEVVSVDYALSPEAGAGVALGQCLAVWRAVAPGRLALAAGDSAGGNLAACLVFAILAADGRARLPDGLALLYPAADLTDTASFSYRRFGSGYGLDADEMAAYARLYADPARQRLPTVSPIFGDFARWPPSLVVTCQFDLLRDQGRALAAKIADAGHAVRYRCIEGTVHGCLTRPGMDAARSEILAEVKAFVDRLKA